jgi:formylglycine-generating enzyme required for sulfatase activity
MVLAAVAYAAIRWRPDEGPRDAPPPEPAARRGADSGADAAHELPDAQSEQVEAPLLDLLPDTLDEQRTVMLENMRRRLQLTEDQLAEVQRIVTASDWMGQGNPKPTMHPMSRAECVERRAKSARHFQGGERCGAPYMVPLYDPERGEGPADARACIDQFEFPNVPCEYPVVWVQANEAVALCRAVGKRICDAHEWEGACAGSLREPEVEYAFGQRRLQMEHLHNEKRPITWSYGPEKNHALCAMGSRKNPGCVTPTWQKCGSNTYPAGAFPECVSKLGVYDLNGNAAEHMNLPLTRAELASAGGLGQTEMKGSWFIFQMYEAHPDDCRWRARNWHGSAINARGSHRNYHLGFRCCKNIGDGTPAPKDAGPR